MVAGCRRWSGEEENGFATPRRGSGSELGIREARTGSGDEEEDLRPLDCTRGIEDGAFSPALYFSPLSFQSACGGLTLLTLGRDRLRSLLSLNHKVHLSLCLQFAASGGLLEAEELSAVLRPGWLQTAAAERGVISGRFLACARNDNIKPFGDNIMPLGTAPIRNCQYRMAVSLCVCSARARCRCAA